MATFQEINDEIHSANEEKTITQLTYYGKFSSSNGVLILNRNDSAREDTVTIVVDGFDAGLTAKIGKIVSTAPDLLEALKCLISLNDASGPFGGEIQTDQIDRAWDFARFAIAKATGAA